MEKGLTIDQIAEGQKSERSFTVTEERINLFAEATGDTNPLHLDEAFAEKTIFKKRVAHGMLSAGFISGELGTRFPGIGTIYLSQTMQFLKPVFIGDTITARLTVLERIEAKNRIRMETVCVNQNDEVVLKGEAVVMPPK